MYLFTLLSLYAPLQKLNSCFAKRFTLHRTQNTSRALVNAPIRDRQSSGGLVPCCLDGGWMLGARCACLSLPWNAIVVGGVCLVRKVLCTRSTSFDASRLVRSCIVNRVSSHFTLVVVVVVVVVWRVCSIT